MNALKQELSIEKRMVESLRTQSNLGAVEKVQQQLAEQQDLVKMMQRQQKAAPVVSADEEEVQKLRSDLAEQQDLVKMMQRQQKAAPMVSANEEEVQKLRNDLAEQQDLVKMMQRQQKAAPVVSANEEEVQKLRNDLAEQQQQVIVLQANAGRRRGFVAGGTNRQADGAATAVLSKQVNALKQELSIEKRTVESLRTQSNLGAVEKVQQQLAEQQDLVKMMQRQQKAAVVVSSTDRIVSKKGKQIVSEEGQVII